METVFDCDNKSMSEIEIDIDDSYISDKGCLNPFVMLRLGQSEHRLEVAGGEFKYVIIQQAVKKRCKR